LVVVDDTVISLYEVNGENLNQDPHATQFTSELTYMRNIPFPHLEYRLTDATALDEAMRFWVINYFFPGEFYLFPFKDPLAELYGEGPTHEKSTIVERLVEFQYSAGGIDFSGSPPVQIQLSSETPARNWEGLVRFDGFGFLLVTDKFPDSLLGFLPYP